MKKSIFLLAAGMFAFTACTSEDIVEESIQANAIGFTNTVSKESRALTNSSLEHFYVYGYYTKDGFTGGPVTVFNGVDVAKADGKWGYTDVRYWVPTTTYYFYAYSCDNNKVNATYGNPSMNIGGTDVNARALRLQGYQCDYDHQHDLCFAYVESVDGDTPEGQTTHPSVAFNFKHILSKLNVEFTSGFAAGYDLVISEVKIEDIFNKANYNPKSTSSSLWNTPTRVYGAENALPYVALSVPADGNVCAVANGDVEAKKVTTGEVYVIPNNYGETETVRLTFHVVVKKGNDVVLDTYLSGGWSPNWELGKSYTYNVNISGSEAGLDPIVFETSTDMNLDWATGSTDQVDMSF